MEIHTLALVQIFTNLIQVLVLFIQYRLNKTHRALGWWTLGSAALALGFVANSLREVHDLGKIAIVGNNVLFIVGLGLIFVGVSSFFARRERVGLLLIFCTALCAFTTYFTVVSNNLSARRLILSTSIALFSFLIARAFIVHKKRVLAVSAHFLAVVFAFNGCFFLMRALTTFASGPVGSLFTASLIQILTYLDVLICSTLWTFGFIILVNQRLKSESDDAREHFELIFKTSPDAVLITRLVDGCIVDINDGFSALTGFSRTDVLGKSTLGIGLWKKGEERQKLVDQLTEQGGCENWEVAFQRKNGTDFIGMLSARTLTLQGLPHLLSVTRDITERKRAELQIQDLVCQLELERDHAQASARTDSLTKLANRRTFDEMLNREFYRLKRTGAPMSLVMLDVDHFKKFNDTYGHLSGDECLRKVAAALRNVVRRAADLSARYGGEEFAVILPDTDCAGAKAVAEHIRKAVEDLAIPHAASDSAKCVTASLGVVEVYPALLSDPERLVFLADSALYRAKDKGRNRIEIADHVNIQEQVVIGEQSGFVRLIWHPSHASGNSTIDEQHMGLFEASNKLLSAIIERTPKCQCRVLFEGLLGEVVNHFRDEEAVIRASAYPFVEEHVRCHAELVEKATKLHEKYLGDELTVGELFGFIATDIVAKHMLVEDKKFFSYL